MGFFDGYNLLNLGNVNILHFKLPFLVHELITILLTGIIMLLQEQHYEAPIALSTDLSQ